MPPLLQISQVSKTYPAFTLQDISFSLEAGYIMGFIGINGAGKTTTLKAMLNLVHADSGSVQMFGKRFSNDELAIKQQLGILFGDLDFYIKKRVSTVTSVIKRFYHNWDDAAYASYCQQFRIDQNKRLCELSKGMRTKYGLALALSHHAKLFILDEPTSGLDPAARDELLEIFQKLVEEGDKSVLFSTHITSDLDTCADFITYIHDGKLIGSAAKDDFLERYLLVKGEPGQLSQELKSQLIAYKLNTYSFSGLIEASRTQLLKPGSLVFEAPSLADIMIYYAKKESLYA